VRPDLTDQDAGTVRSDVQNHIAALDGTIDKEDIWGKRQLSFEIKDFTEGFYTLYVTKLPPEGVKTLNDRLKIDERIIRHSITLKESAKPV
jgi:small subunit ribosomal protein S6